MSCNILKHDTWVGCKLEGVSVPLSNDCAAVSSLIDLKTERHSFMDEHDITQYVIGSSILIFIPTFIADAGIKRPASRGLYRLGGSGFAALQHPLQRAGNRGPPGFEQAKTTASLVMKSTTVILRITGLHRWPPGISEGGQDWMTTVRSFVRPNRSNLE